MTRNVRHWRGGAHIVRWISRGPLLPLAQCCHRIPYLRIRRLVRYDLTDIESYLQRCRIGVRSGIAAETDHEPKHE